MKKFLHLGLISVLALALASCAPQRCVAGTGDSYAPATAYAPVSVLPSYPAPGPVFVQSPAYQSTTVYVTPPRRTTAVRPVVTYRSPVSTYRSYSTRSGSFGGTTRRR